MKTWETNRRLQDVGPEITSGQTGPPADPHERTHTRTTLRNGTQDKTISTTAGDLTVKIAKTRTGSGVSTFKGNDLVTALSTASGISESEVSRICAELDTDVSARNTRDLGEQGLPYVFLDATYCKARVDRVATRRPRPGASAVLGSSDRPPSISALIRSLTDGAHTQFVEEDPLGAYVGGAAVEGEVQLAGCGD